MAVEHSLNRTGEFPGHFAGVQIEPETYQGAVLLLYLLKIADSRHRSLLVRPRLPEDISISGMAQPLNIRVESALGKYPRTGVTGLLADKARLSDDVFEHVPAPPQVNLLLGKHDIPRLALQFA